MIAITIKQLHERTGEWVRNVETTEGITVTDRGRPVARLAPPLLDPRTNLFLQRRLLPDYAAIMNKKFGGKSVTKFIS